MGQAADVPTEDDLIAKVSREGLPVAFQALWDGDTQGWMLCFDAVFASGGRHRASTLAVLRFGGDIRLFQGSVPPWPEARVASELGRALSAHFGVPFWFPSPDEPDADCPAWWEQSRSHGCDDCGKRILPRNTPHLPENLCYHCHLRREARARLRRDEPAPAGVTVLLGAPGEEQRFQSSSSTTTLRIVRFATEALATAGAAQAPAELVVEGELVRRFEALLHAEVKTLLARHDSRPARAANAAATMERIEARGKVAFEGRELELELRFDKLGRELYGAILELERARDATRNGHRYWLVFSRGMTSRRDRVLRLLRQLEGASTVEAIAERCQGDLDAGEVRDALARLSELGHVTLEGEAARLTRTGWHVG